MAFQRLYFAVPITILLFSLQSVAQGTAALTPGIPPQAPQLVRRLPSAGMFPPAAAQLPRSIPEREGVSSKGIAGFLDAVAARPRDEFHSFMFLRHGKVIAEGWWDPYRPDLKHSLYSVSKSFTSTAVGLAVSEGRMKVSDKVVSFFPHDLPDSVSPYLSSLSVKDLLSMTEGQEPDPTSGVINNDSNWVRSFLSIPIQHQPGAQFLYNSLGVYVLSAIVQKVTGQKVLDYLAPRLFQPLGIEGADWEISPQQINTGGWGLRLKTEDLAKIGQLYLRKGNWNGRQVLPVKWVDEATSVSIMQSPDPRSNTPKDSSDWLQGYGYLFWRCRKNNIYRADGAFGQYIIVMPDQDAVVAITSETPDMQDELNLVWNYLLPAIQKDPLPADPQGLADLRQRLSSLALALPAKTPEAPLAASISGKIFSTDPYTTKVSTISQAAETPASGRALNPSTTLAAAVARIKSISFSFNDVNSNGAGSGERRCLLTVTTDTGAFRLAFGQDRWERGATHMHCPSLTGRAKSSLVGLPPFQVAGSYHWKDGNTLELVLRYIETPHTQRMTCQFDQRKLTATMHNSFEWNNEGAVWEGEIR